MIQVQSDIENILIRIKNCPILGYHQMLRLPLQLFYSYVMGDHVR